MCLLIIPSLRRLDPWCKGEEPEGEGTCPHANQGTEVHKLDFKKLHVYMMHLL